MRTLALHQWRRNKGAFLGFGATILIAACMLGSALTLLFTVGPRYTALADELHTADVDIVVPRTAATADVRDVIDHTTGVAAVDPHDVLLMDTQIHDFRGTDFAIRAMITDADASRTLNQTRVLATSGDSGDLYVAQYTAWFGQFAPGDRIELQLAGHDESFRTAGVVEEMEFGNAGSQILAFSAPAARFTQLERAYPQARMTEYAVSISAGADPRAVRSHIDRALADAGVPVAAAIDCDSVRATRTMVSRLIILILVVFAVLVTVVSLALCTFHIRNIVKTDRTDMGVLKALGYTSQMISHAMMAPYLLVCGRDVGRTRPIHTRHPSDRLTDRAAGRLHVPCAGRRARLAHHPHPRGARRRHAAVRVDWRTLLACTATDRSDPRHQCAQPAPYGTPTQPHAGQCAHGDQPAASRRIPPAQPTRGVHGVPDDPDRQLRRSAHIQRHGQTGQPLQHAVHGDATGCRHTSPRRNH
ncbi:hypothetical protein LDX61_04670 [Bifidobacterium pseudolongum]|uniref:hypothetical protein n=1 Tax=Bifidobacterium pseudolongum TaxID=1694 RepID=UPI001CE1DF38|nr:hypothetical protein [Bifidobacterium pseudolongum]UBY93626.1 hypothetical protein LDX61_04670 [Bifidobacterium pseudolongum]UBZ02459.1 hypothetical protein LDH93_04675 [Bifidobacterium pseudolongum]